MAKAYFMSYLVELFQGVQIHLLEIKWYGLGCTMEKLCQTAGKCSSDTGHRHLRAGMCLEVRYRYPLVGFSVVGLTDLMGLFEVCCKNNKTWVIFTENKINLNTWTFNMN